MSSAYDRPPTYEACISPPTYEESLTEEYYKSRTTDSSQHFNVGKNLRRRANVSGSGDNQSERRISLGSEPEHTICPYCMSSVTTEVVKGPTMDMSFLKFLMNIFCCCFCSERTHYCPRCYKIISSFNRNNIYEQLT